VKPRTTTRIVQSTVAVALSLLWAFPVYWMAVTAIKPSQDVLSRTPVFLPTSPTLEHLRTAVSAPGFWTFARNSVVLTLGSVLLALLIALAAAWASTRFRFRGRRTFLLLIMAAQLAPWEAMLIPIFIVYRDTGGLDVLLALIPLYMVMVLPFTVWTLRGFIAAVPLELEEAALVDGCSRGQAFRRIVFPLLAPGVMATSLFGFITIWNEFVFVNALMQSEQNSTLPRWISAFQTVFGTDWGATMAASTLFTIPVLIVFAILQRRAVGGLAAGAVKG
jgi:N,N'-diacetylchitobiose transport system permease protein